MTKELEDKILQRFPWILVRNVWTDKKLNFCTPCSCGSGWFQLIYDLCEAIEEHYKKNKANIKSIRILQIKEKWAELCFYTGGLIEGTHEIIHEFEKKSTTICELCGEPAEIRIQGTWLKTLCEKHRDELGYRDCKEFYEEPDNV